MESDVGVDVQFHVRCFQRGDADGDFSTPVAHGADVGQQGVVGEWRYADIVEVEHIGGAGVVIVGGEQQTVAEQGDVDTGIEGMFYFPFQVGVGIPQVAQGDNGGVSYGDNAVRFDEVQGCVGVDSALVACQTVADTEFQVIDHRELFHEFLFTDYPGGGCGREKSPFMIRAEF